MPEEKKGVEKAGKEKAGSLVLEASEGLLLPPLPRGLHLLRGGAKGSLLLQASERLPFASGRRKRKPLGRGGSKRKPLGSLTVMLLWQGGPVGLGELRVVSGARQQRER